MKRILGWGVAILLAVAAGASTAAAGNWDDPFFDHPWSPRHRFHRTFVDDTEPHSALDFTVLSGVQLLRRNKPALSDNVYSVPTTALQIANGVVAQRKGPDLLLYQAGVRISAPGETYLLYVAGGGGMATFLINTEPTRYPQIARVEDVAAFNAGVGAMFYLSPAWSLRFDFRQFALFPPTDSPELSPDGTGSTLWLQRAAIGLTYGHQPRVVRDDRDPFFRSSW